MDRSADRRILSIQWLATAALALRTDHSGLVIDPFLTLRGAENKTVPEDFEPYDDILVTHGHFDHIGSLKELYHRRKRRIFCTKTPADTLAKIGISRDDIQILAPGDHFSIGDFQITVFQSRHVVYDRKILRKTLCNIRMLKNAYNLPYIIANHPRCVENGETVGFLIEASGYSVYVMGSLAIDPDVNYPQHPDVLVLPYQGTSDLITPAIEVIRRTKPRSVLVDHFDDAFPPISSHVAAEDLVAAIGDKIPVTVPDFRGEYSVHDIMR